MFVVNLQHILILYYHNAQYKVSNTQMLLCIQFQKFKDSIFQS